MPRENLHDSLGPDCVNLKRARALPGIVRILPREDGLYTVIAKDENSMNEAREILDFVSELIFVEQPLAGHIIGKHATNIENIVKTSHVSKIDVLDTPDMLRNRGIDEWRERCVAFLITGSRADTDAAKMLIEYQVQNRSEFLVPSGLTVNVIVVSCMLLLGTMNRDIWPPHSCQVSTLAIISLKHSLFKRFLPMFTF